MTWAMLNAQFLCTQPARLLDQPLIGDDLGASWQSPAEERDWEKLQALDIPAASSPASASHHRLRLWQQHPTISVIFGSQRL